MMMLIKSPYSPGLVRGIRPCRRLGGGVPRARARPGPPPRETADRQRRLACTHCRAHRPARTHRRPRPVVDTSKSEEMNRYAWSM